MDSTLAAGDAVPARWRALARALIAPCAVTLFALVPFLLLPSIDGADRAIVWVEGDAATLRRIETAMASESAFAGGIRETAGNRPRTCGADAVRLHFDVRRVDEAGVTRDALHRLAHAAGATVCAGGRFELGHADAVTAWWPLLVSIVLPLGLLAVLRVVPPEVPPARPRIASETVAAALAVALLAAVLAPSPLDAPGAFGTMLGLAVAVLPPLIQEAAFRGWMIPRLEPAFGAAASGGLSVAASVAAGAAIDLAAATTGAVVGAACVVVYFATRSLATCIAVHLLLATLGRVVSA